MTHQDEGFSVVELLLSTAIMSAVAAAAFMMLVPAREWLRVQPERSDMHQRLRIAVGAVERDLVMAGAGPYIGRGAGPLSRSLAAVVPYRTGERNPDAVRGVFYRPDALSVVYVPSTTAQTRIRYLTTSGSAHIVSVEPNCGDLHDRLCGFAPGMPVILWDSAGRFFFAGVTSIVGTTVSVEGNVPGRGVDPAASAWLVEVTQRTFWLDSEGSVPRLMRYDGRRTDAPVVDDVVDLRFEYFGTSEPPMLLPGADLEADEGPWTTYGPKPPPISHDEPDDEWPAGENCVFGAADGVHVPRLAALAPAMAIVVLDAASLVDGPWCPDATHPRRFDADLLRVRRVRMIVRVQASSPSFRGRVGGLFVRGGTAVSPHSLIADQEVQVDVWPRNVNLMP